MVRLHLQVQGALDGCLLDSWSFDLDEVEDLQEAMASLIYRLSDAHYAGRDWTGRARKIEALVAPCYSVSGPCEVGPLPGGQILRVVYV